MLLDKTKTSENQLKHFKEIENIIIKYDMTIQNINLSNNNLNIELFGKRM